LGWNNGEDEIAKIIFNHHQIVKELLSTCRLGGSFFWITAISPDQ
jgi:hypothetical protein